MTLDLTRRSVKGVPLTAADHDTNLDKLEDAIEATPPGDREWSAATISQAEAEAGTETTRRAWTAQRVRQAIAAWWTGASTAAGRAMVEAASAAAQRTLLGLSVEDSPTFTGLTITGTGPVVIPHIHGSIAGNFYVHVRNTSGGSLPAGTAVCVTGSVGDTDRLQVVACDPTDPLKMPAVAVLEVALANNGDGDAVILGELRPFNTSGLTLNAALYVGAGGALAATEPTSGIVQSVATVARVNAQTGTLVIHIGDKLGTAALRSVGTAAGNVVVLDGSARLPAVDGSQLTGLAGVGEPGADGDSAYEVAVTNGFSGTEAQWLASLVGADGADGAPGADGADGAPGADGADGLSVLSGSGAPSSGLGVDGEFFIDTDADTIYGPKTAGSWGSPTSLVGPAGAPGADGAPGAAGADGIDGDDGAPGADGIDGRTILSGAVDPTTEGEDGDFYINTASSTLFGPKAAGTWPSGVLLIGADGAPGADGAAGADGADGADGLSVLSGAGAPSSGLGANGEFYIDTTANAIYGPKTAGAWGSPTSLIGPAGADGADGADGATGPSGGSTNWRGTWDPATAYVASTLDAVTYQGSSYVAIANSTNQAPPNATFWQLLAAKGDTGAAGADGADGADGAPGAPGAAGADGRTILNGSGAPGSGLGADDDFYIDTTADAIYGPKTAGAWGSPTSLIGPAGSDGADGADGADGDIGDWFILACSDETTALTIGANKLRFRMPYAGTLTAIRASVNTAPTGAALVIDVNEAGTTLLSTKLSIDATELTSTTAAAPAVISDSALADDAEISIDIDQVGSTVAGAGLKVGLFILRA